MSLRENFEEKMRDGRWTGSTNNIGYPKIKDDGKLRLASHVALELDGRKAPGPGKVVLHKDNNPKNLEPSNLAVSTQKANLKQMRDQGRDRPRGVPQEPDEKNAGAIGGLYSIRQYEQARRARRVENYKSGDPHRVELQRRLDEDLLKSASWDGFVDELKTLLASM